MNGREKYRARPVSFDTIDDLFNKAQPFVLVQNGATGDHVHGHWLCKVQACVWT
jgi:hypothetical protein